MEKELKQLLGKTVREIIYNDGYCNIQIIFSDNSILNITAYECGEFLVKIYKDE